MPQFTIQHLGGQFNVNLPEEGVPFRHDPAQSNSVLMRRGGTLIRIDPRKFPGDVDTLPVITLTGDMEAALEIIRRTAGGSRVEEGSPLIFSEALKTPAESSVPRTLSTLGPGETIGGLAEAREKARQAGTAIPDSRGKRTLPERGETVPVGTDSRIQQIQQQIREAQATLDLAKRQRTADVAAGRPLTFEPGTATPQSAQTQNNDITRLQNDPTIATSGDYGKTPGGIVDLRTGKIVAPPTAAPGIAPSVPSTGDDRFDEILKRLQSILDKFAQQGKILNPNIELTPEKTAEFLRQAEEEIDPFFKTQLKLARENFLQTVGFATNEIQTIESDLERKYGVATRQLGEQAAEQGFALSGIRERGERELAGETQRDIEARRRQLEFTTGQQARTFAQQFGTQEIPIPTIAQAPTVTPGEQRFGRDERQLPIFSLSPDVYEGLIGEREFQRRGAVKARQAELGEAERRRLFGEQQRELFNIS